MRLRYRFQEIMGKVRNAIDQVLATALYRRVNDLGVEPGEV